MKTKLSFSAYATIGVMLFALFFGAGNLIFPAQLGQYAGTNLTPAIIGFLVTGVGLPLLGVLAIGFSGSSNLQELASRVHPIYGVVFTVLLYLTIGPFFATPRTGTVAYDIGFSTFFGDSGLALFIFTLIFFAITLLFSLNPAKIVDRVGKLLAPGIIILLAVLIGLAIFNPMGSIQGPQEAYASSALTKGILEGYNTMDALASLVFAIIVINAVKALGVTNKREILSATAKSGVVASSFLAIIYMGIAYIGATSTEFFGLFETGGPVLSSAAGHYFGTFGNAILAVIITLACLTTSIGLITACAEYFHTLMPKISYKNWAVLFTLVSFTIANFGLANIISFSIPMLMLLYPLAITLMLLTFLSPLFNHSRLVYVASISVAFVVGIFDGLKALCDSLKIDYFGWMQPIITFYENSLPLYGQGLGWLVPVLVVTLITGVIARFLKVQAPAELGAEAK